MIGSRRFLAEGNSTAPCLFANILVYANKTLADDADR